MSYVAAGALDRRILIQTGVETKDAAGDVIDATWDDAFKLWARRVPRSQGIEKPTVAGVLREFDIRFDVRDSPKSRAIAPETHRVLYKGRIYEIVGTVALEERDDLIGLLCATRPDQRGSRGNEGVSGQP